MADSSNKRIAKNTAMLYFRMLFTMAVGVYTSRVVLEQLGVQDYGIYNVVGGVVSMFSIISASLSTAISRFLTFELGKGREENLKLVFSTSLLIQLSIGLVVAISVESIGVWFVNCKMNIAPERMGAANWVLQCSMITFVINMISVPYNATIIAHERMQAFAYISILEALMKLAVAFLLFVKIFDSLKVYAVLLMLSSLIIRWVYTLYCKRHFIECHFKWRFDRRLMKEMMSFSGWNFIGSSSAILRDQGVNIVMNLFCGTAVNAARGIAVQVNGIVNSFSSNFMVAVNPQIIKSYAAGEKESMFRLMRNSSRLSYFLLFLISFPIILTAPYVLNIWLTIVPEYTVPFTRLILVFSMLEAISLPLQFVNQATGKIKIYQLTVGGLQLLNFPLSYIALYLGYNPEITFVISICISQICMFARLLILRKTTGLSVRTFLKKVYLRILLVTLFASPLPIFIITVNPVYTFAQFLGMLAFSIILTSIVIFCIGCDKSERLKLISIVREKILKN